MFLLENIPYRQNRLFTDRQEILERIHQDFLSRQIQEETHFQALTGPIGIGKTQIALAYALKYESDYKVCFWFDATSDRSLYESTVSLAELLKLPEQDRVDDQSLYLAMKRWLQRHDQWLLVLDNLADMTLLDVFIPQRSRGHVLITTLRQTLELFTYPIPIPPMDRNDCADFLLQRSGFVDKSAKEASYCFALTISDEVDHISLVLDQAGAYIQETCCSLEKYLDAYRKCARKLLAFRGQSVTTHQESIEVAITLTLNKVASKHPEALALLRLCAFLQRDAIPTDLLADGAVVLDGPLRPLAREDLVQESIRILRHFSLLQHSANTATFNMSRVLQTILRDKMPQNVQRQWVQRAVRLIYTVFPSAEFETWPVCEKYLIQAKHCALLIEEFSLVEDEAAQLLVCLGSFRYQRAYYQEAEHYFKQALPIFQAIAGSAHPGTSYTLNALGLLYHMQGDYLQAEAFYQRALELRKTARKLDQHAVAQTSNNLANLYKDQGKLREAVELLREAITLDERVLGQDHPETLKIKSNLAFIYDEQGHHQQAEKLHTLVYTLGKQTLPVGHPDRALSLNALATNAKALGDYQRAETLYQEAILLQKQYLGDDHSDTAQSLNNLASLYTCQARYEEAAWIYQQALTIYEDKFGTEHLLIAVVLTNLGWLYHLMQQEERAEELLRRSLTIHKEIPGKDTLDRYNCLKVFTKFLTDLHRYEEACAFAQDVIHICHNLYDPENRHIFDAQERYVSLLQRVNKDVLPDYQGTHLMQDIFSAQE